jgi:Fic family protein
VPLSTKVELEAEFSLFIEKLRSITNPREQSLFVLVFVPYFQAFMDINKRTSRMMANLPLLKNNLPLISLLSVEKKEYITAILAIYELQDTSLLSAIYTENYTERASRYSS